mmetsp:Transcript_3833/g.8734  ORF Transcript_3833/g.8734 Transcript_3833/m.8734 type:complete len:393 (+) Transcript_3833:2795-3973(+)
MESGRVPVVVSSVGGPRVLEGRAPLIVESGRATGRVQHVIEASGSGSMIIARCSNHPAARGCPLVAIDLVALGEGRDVPALLHLHDNIGAALRVRELRSEVDHLQLQDPDRDVRPPVLEHFHRGGEARSLATAFNVLLAHQVLRHREVQRSLLQHPLEAEAGRAPLRVSAQPGVHLFRDTIPNICVEHSNGFVRELGGLVRLVGQILGHLLRNQVAVRVGLQFLDPQFALMDEELILEGRHRQERAVRVRVLLSLGSLHLLLVRPRVGGHRRVLLERNRAPGGRSRPPVVAVEATRRSPIIHPVPRPVVKILVDIPPFTVSIHLLARGPTSALLRPLPARHGCSPHLGRRIEQVVPDAAGRDVLLLCDPILLRQFRRFHVHRLRWFDARERA